MWLDGEPIDPAETYSVTVNSFLATGGDNFGALRQRHRQASTPARSTCRRWSTTWPSTTQPDPLPVDYSQRAVGVTFPAGCSGGVRRG